MSSAIKYRLLLILPIALGACLAVVTANAQESSGKSTGRPAKVPHYYVSPQGNDANNGSFKHPWKTIQHAAMLVMPGATVHVAPGNYAGDIMTAISGTAAARIRFVSDARWGAKIRSGSEFVWNNTADYVDIEGFDVSGEAIARIGILNWASWVRVLNNRVHDIPAPNCPGFGGAGIDHAGYKSSDSDTLGNWIFNIGDYNRPCPRVHGIYQAEAGGVIQNNIVYRAEGWGIHLYHAAHDLIVANNTVFNNAYGGILVGQDDGKVPIADDILVTNNIVYRNGLVHGADGYGVREYGRTGIHNKYINNLVSGNGPGDWRLQNGNAPSGTIAADPHFVDYRPDGTGDYHLQPGSPAINTGTDVGAPTKDFEGRDRPAGSGIDIGAYQHLATSTSASERRNDTSGLR